MGTLDQRVEHYFQRLMAEPGKPVRINKLKRPYMSRANTAERQEVADRLMTVLDLMGQPYEKLTPYKFVVLTQAQQDATRISFTKRASHGHFIDSKSMFDFIGHIRKVKPFPGTIIIDDIV